MNHFTAIEPLEPRIAPAAIISPTEVTFLDANGETAVVKISKPLFTSAAAAGKILVFTDPANQNAASPFASTGPQDLDHINLLGSGGTALTAAQDMNISVTLIPQRDGPHTVNVGHIDAAVFDPNTGKASQNIDLGKITIQGDLGHITAGDNFSTPAIKSLDVLSMTQGGTSIVLSSITSLHIAGDFNSFLNVAGGVFGRVDNMKIDGALRGIIQFSGRIGTATIGSMVGNDLFAFNGSLLGFTGANSSIGSLHVLGSVTGGAKNDSAEIYANGTIGKIVIDGDLSGSSNVNSSSPVVGSGYIQGGHIQSVKIGGNVSAFANAGTGGIANSGAIRASGKIDSLEIDGSVTGVKGNPVFISAVQGSTSKHAALDVALGSVTIKGNATYLDVLAGYGPDTSTTTGTGSGAVTNPVGAPLGAPLDGTAQIGTVSVGGNLSSSNIAAGVARNPGGYFGAAGDSAIHGADNKTGLHSSIAKIIVGGTATGDGTNSGSFGFVAQQVVSILVNQVDLGKTLLQPGPENDLVPKQISGNLFALEVGP